MKLIVEIELDNAAFKDGEELPQLLADLAERVPDPPSLTSSELILHDSNGNWVGYARIVRGTIKGRRE